MIPPLEHMTGDWQLARRITQANGRDIRASGRARFTPDGTGLSYEETVTLQIDGSAIQGRRRYLWRSGGVVLFEDGRAFHTIPEVPGAEATHLCPPDSYVVRYDFTEWPFWTARWSVTGPRKSYVMETRYTRA